MRSTRQPAFVLHAQPWRETSLLVELLTRDHGRIGVVARGVRGSRSQPLRAALQPLQAIHADYVQRGELATLVRAEAAEAPPALAGNALLAAFYLSELVLRLAPRGDALPGLFVRYAHALAELSSHATLAWTLRRFERDLLDELGYGLPFDRDAEGVPLDPAARYRIEAEHGPKRVFSVREGVEDRGISGAALLALAADREPPPDQLRELRGALRAVIAHHLGPRGLRSWGLPGELARLFLHPL